MKQKRGFTLIELLIVIGIIAILAAIIFVAVNPARRLAEARNADRWSSVNAILNAYLKYTVDNDGTEPATIAVDNALMIGTGADATGCTATDTDALVDLSTNLVDDYLPSVPTDPSAGSAAKTFYYVIKSTNGRITIGSCAPEAVGGSTPTINVSR